MVLLLVFLAGGLGCVLRYGVVEAIKPLSPTFPAGTLIANVAGCFAFGLLAHWLFARTDANAAHKTAVLVGLLGGFTTFSSFGHDTVRLWADGRAAMALANVLLNNVLGVAAAAGGLAVGGGLRDPAG